MSLDQGPSVLEQCSRPAPGETKGPLWSPVPAQIEELEAELPAYLRAQKHAKTADGLGLFLRQYIGFVRAGRKLIYLNAIPVSLEGYDQKMCREHPELISKELCEPGRWRHEPHMVCDGGDDFWGLEYDPESKAFSALEFNGEA